MFALELNWPSTFTNVLHVADIGEYQNWGEGSAEQAKVSSSGMSPRRSYISRDA